MPENFIDENNEKAMFKWSCEFHNHVNRSKTPPSPVLNWEIIYKDYENNASKDNNESMNTQMTTKTSPQRFNEDIYKKLNAKK